MTKEDRLVHTVTKLIRKLYVTPEGRYYWRKYTGNVYRDSDTFVASSDEAAIRQGCWARGPWKLINQGDEK